MGDIGTKIDKFIEIFINNRGYVKVLEGLKNTLIIAVIGLVIGVVIGTLSSLFIASPIAYNMMKNKKVVATTTTED